MAKSGKTTRKRLRKLSTRKPGASPKGSLLHLSLEDLQPNPHQPRGEIDLKSLKELANSIQEQGLIHPILLKENGDGGYDVVAGARRVEAFRVLQRSEIPALVTDGSKALLALIENMQREDLHPLEEAEGIQKLMERHGYSQAKVAKLLGKSRTTINETLRLLKLPGEIREGCRTSDTPKSVLVEVSRMKDPDEQQAAWQKASNGGLTVRETRSRKKQPGRARPPAAPAEIALRKGRAFFESLEAVSPDDERYPELVELVGRMHTLLCELTPVSVGAVD